MMLTFISGGSWKHLAGGRTHFFLNLICLIVSHCSCFSIHWCVHVWEHPLVYCPKHMPRLHSPFMTCQSYLRPGDLHDEAFLMWTMGYFMPYTGKFLPISFCTGTSSLNLPTSQRIVSYCLLMQTPLCFSPCVGCGALTLPWLICTPDNCFLRHGLCTPQAASLGQQVGS